MEAKFCNLSGTHILLESVAFRCAFPFLEALDLNVQTQGGEHSAGCLMPPDGVQQFLFRIVRRSGPNSEDGTPPMPTSLGFVDIVWRSSLGERGNLQTPHLQSKPPAELPVELSLDLPGNVTLQVGESHDTVATITNRTAQVS